MKPKSRYERIRQLMLTLNQPEYRYRQIIDAIFRRRIGQYSRMTMLPRALRDELAEQLGDRVSCITPVLERASNQVGKILFAIPGGERVEAVKLSYKRGWESYCISSQCGCGFGCSFCATGTIGLKRNLTTDEISDQLLHFHLNGYPLDSVSFMGMGEALANPNLFDALNVLTDPRLFGLSQRRITISTIGILPAMHRLREEFPQINLTFSLHSPFDAQRSELMPINKRFPLNEVMEALDSHIRHTGRKVYIAYILLKGINDSPEHTEAIADLLRGRGPWERLFHVNLIPYNSTDALPGNYVQSGKSNVGMFVRRMRSRGIKVTVRTQFGTDIDAACGQLYGSEGPS